MSDERVESSTNSDGFSSRWIHDENHGPWQVTAPTWAVMDFIGIQRMMDEGKWSPPLVVGGMSEGHLVHCDGIWDNGELIVPPGLDTYYEATVAWSDGKVGPLCLWNETGNR